MVQLLTMAGYAVVLVVLVGSATDLRPWFGGLVLLVFGGPVAFVCADLYGFAGLAVAAVALLALGFAGQELGPTLAVWATRVQLAVLALLPQHSRRPVRVTSLPKGRSIQPSGKSRRRNGRRGQHR